jgi:hypothetical protein
LDAAGCILSADFEFGDEDPGLVEADADTEVVCGSLGALRNGLKSHDGVSLEVTEGRDEEARSFLDTDDRVERTEWTEDWDGEVLRLLPLVDIFS